MSAKAWSSGSASRRGAAGRERRRLQALQAAATCLWEHQEHDDHQPGSEGAEYCNGDAEAEAVAEKADHRREQCPYRPSGIVAKALTGPAHLGRVKLRHEGSHRRE